MDPSVHISPAMERLWIDEVRRLHALWHLGPPRSTSTPDPLAATNTTAFKREERRKRKDQKKQLKKQQQLDQPTCPSNPNVSHCSADSITAVEWPCPPVLDHASDEVRGWGEKESNQEQEQKQPIATPSKPLLEDEKVKIFALRAQQECVNASRVFFSEQCSSDDEEDLMEEDDDDASGDSTYFKFFMEVFEKDGDLRGYYQRNWEKGEFCCLVCGGIGEKVGKRFMDCVSLVQHSNSISKTKRKEAHRVFAMVVCRVLGWNIERLPRIVLDVGDQLGLSSVKSVIPSLQVDEQKDSVLIQKEELLIEAPDTAEIVNKDAMDVMEVKEDMLEDGVLNQKKELPGEVPEPLGTDNADAMELMGIKESPQKDNAEELPKQVIDSTGMNNEDGSKLMETKVILDISKDFMDNLAIIAETQVAVIEDSVTDLTVTNLSDTPFVG